MKRVIKIPNNIGKCRITRNASTKIKTQEFIKAANEIHNFKYSYDKSVYINTKTKLLITCKKHGDFYQKPNIHLNGFGCPLCGKEIVQIHNNILFEKSKKEFVDKANKLFNYKYDYSLFDYKGTNEKGIIICPQHGKFLKEPNKHLNRKQGCPFCSKQKTISKGELEIKNILEENKLDYKMEFIIKKSKYLKNKPFDFYIPALNLLIEFQGEQHFIKKFKMTDEDLAERKNIDIKKKKFALKYNYIYLEIKYNENIKEKLEKYLVQRLSKT